MQKAVDLGWLVLCIGWRLVSFPTDFSPSVEKSTTSRLFALCREKYFSRRRAKSRLGTRLVGGYSYQPQTEFINISSNADGLIAGLQHYNQGMVMMFAFVAGRKRTLSNMCLSCNVFVVQFYSHIIM